MDLARPGTPVICLRARAWPDLRLGLPSPAPVGFRTARGAHRLDGVPVACSTHAVRVLETAHPPTYYIPWVDIARHLLQPAPGGSFCEWKGPARYWSLVDGDRKLPSHAWSYPQPLAGAEALADCVAFYAHDLTCSVGGLPATPQPGGFYGGWVTPDLAGPFKGEAGSETW